MQMNIIFNQKTTHLFQEEFILPDLKCNRTLPKTKNPLLNEKNQNFFYKITKHLDNTCVKHEDAASLNQKESFGLLILYHLSRQCSRKLLPFPW